MTDINFENTSNDDNNKPSKKSEKKQSINDITKDLIEQLKNNPTELFMTLPIEEPTPKKQNDHGDNNQTMIDHIKQFNTKPKDIKQHLDRYIIGQNNAKKALSIAICDHYNYIKEAMTTTKPTHYTKQNILMIGPTGVGKTYMIKRIAELIGVPFVKSDATKFTETGYQGGDVDDLIRQLYNKANKNSELAQYGIVYLDEIDKITGSISRQHKDVSGRGVQSNLLKLMEDTEVPTQPPWDIQSQIKQMMNASDEKKKDTLKTKHILFIVSGSFTGLDDIIRNRLDGNTIGFERNKIKDSNNNKILQQLRTKDLISFGLEPEFSGRLPVRVSFDELSTNDLYKIMTKTEESILEQYIQSFQRFQIETSFDDDALKEIANQSIEENIGARALSTTMEKIFREFKFELPSTNIPFIFIDEEFVKNPSNTLKQYLSDPNESIKRAIYKEIDKQFKKLPIPEKEKQRIYKATMSTFGPNNSILSVIKSHYNECKKRDKHTS